MDAVLKNFLVPVHRAGWPFIALFAAVSLILGTVVAEPLGWIGALLTVWCVFFFRDPPRVTPVRPGLVVSPADGIVTLIEPAAPPPELDMGSAVRMRVSIFMDVFSVHVNRIPADGRITAKVYTPGKFLNAALDKASEFNERMAMRMSLHDGRDLAFVQIAGLIARRISSDVEPGQEVRAGERFGLIRFGSRVDVYLPDGVAPLVVVGQVAVAGETVLADLSSHEPRREGEIR